MEKRKFNKKKPRTLIFFSGNSVAVSFYRVLKWLCCPHCSSIQSSEAVHIFEVVGRLNTLNWQHNWLLGFSFDEQFNTAIVQCVLYEPILSASSISLMLTFVPRNKKKNINLFSVEKKNLPKVTSFFSPFLLPVDVFCSSLLLLQNGHLMLF